MIFLNVGSILLLPTSRRLTLRPLTKLSGWPAALLSFVSLRSVLISRCFLVCDWLDRSTERGGNSQRNPLSWLQRR